MTSPAAPAPASTTAAAAPTSDRAFMGHPIGLGFLAFCEFWERFSYYGMQTLLVLYMTKQLLLPGHIENIVGFPVFRALLEKERGPLSVIALSSSIFGLYTGLVYLTPIIGGFIADQWLGRTRTITLGALLMAAGHFLMAFDRSFLLALLCLLVGVGCFKGNLASQISALYRPEDLRRADAFQIYYLFINAAVIISPLVCGSLGEKVAWHWGFGAAGVGMLIAVVIYVSGRRWLPVDLVGAKADKAARPTLSRDDWKTIILLVVLIPVLAVGSVGNQEIFNAYLIWVPDHVNMTFLGWTVPTTWLITLDAIVSVTFLVGAVAFWRMWAARRPEPSEVTKITLGLGISALGQLCLAAAAAFSSPGHKASFGWVLGFELCNSAGFANVFPVGMALFARAAPKAVSGTMIGVYLLNLFLCNLFVGYLGGLIDHMAGLPFWLLHTGLVGGACVLTLALVRVAGRLFNPTAQPAAA